MLRQGFITPKFLGITLGVTPGISLILRGRFITLLSFLSLGGTWKRFPDGHSASPPPPLTRDLYPPDLYSLPLLGGMLPRDPSSSAIVSSYIISIISVISITLISSPLL